MNARTIRRLAVFSFAGVIAACGGSSDDDGAGNGDAGGSSDGSDAFDASSSDGAARDAAINDAAIGDAGSDANDVTDAGYDAGPPPPPQVCTPAATLVDVTHPTTVVGTGTAASCTASALASAVATGGIITFACGAAPVTITVPSALAVTANTTIDGDNLVTLSGGGTSRILVINGFSALTTTQLTVQRLAFVDGFATQAADASTGTTSGGGGAIYAVGGSVTVIDSTFADNQCAPVGSDVGGGAIFLNSNGALVVSGSTFTGNKGANGGAIKTLFPDVTITNSRFMSNTASGTGGDPGNGGTGGGLSFDGANDSLSLCGVVFANNVAGSYGGAVFRVGYETTSTTTIDRSTFDSNSAVSLAGGLYLQDHTITLTNSTVSRNTTSGTGGGADLISTTVATPITLENDTIALNTSTNGVGAGLAFGGSMVTGNVTHCTIAGNTAVIASVDGASSAITLTSSVIADNMDTNGINTVSCVAGAFASGGRNFQYPTTDDAGTAEPACAPSITFAEPHLGPLQDNGGPTLTMVPAAGSPADSDAGCAGTDQRGIARSKCTSGAVEGL